MNLPATHTQLGRGPRRRAVALVLVGLALLGPALLQAQTETVRRRGQYLRTEVVRTDAEKTYSCTLAPTSGSYPTLLFRRLERLKQQEVRIYEVVVEERPRMLRPAATR